MNDLGDILEQYWGYTAFRPLQREIAEATLADQDTLAILPTGGGKSICFQVPALAREGICIVISPLIALMKDQVEGLKKRGIPALMIHSGMQRNDVIQTLKNATNSYFKFLYLSPERLETALFREYLPAFDANCIAVDEAHCISQWGYDFRPAYQRIAALREALPGVPVLALTASATPEVQQDIIEKLNLRAPRLFHQSFARKNLSYSAFETEARLNKLREILSRVAGTAIVYCRSRKRTVEVAGLLQLHGISASAYHAGLSAEERNRRQQDWISGKIRVMACTNAFGMGIDKPDVRVVIHMDVPDCLENYYQEAGRAGRDGNRSYCVLLYTRKDIDDLLQQHLLRYPTLEKIKETYTAVCNFLQVPIHTGQDRRYTFRFEDFVRNFRLPAAETLYALKALESDGWFEFNERNFMPSTLVFTTRKRGLYEFYAAHPEHEALLTLLLRTYEGIFDFPSFISETTIARLGKLDAGAVSAQLKTIASFGIVHYVPQDDAPQLVFRKHRVDAASLPFNLAAYHKRRDAFIARAEAMAGYTSTKDCRSRYISSYFGEAKPGACGQCDHCLQARRGPLTDAEFKTISGSILQALAGGPLTVDRLLPVLRTSRDKAWQVIRYLQDEQQVRVGEAGEISLPA